MTVTSDDALATYARGVLKQLMRERGVTQIDLEGVLNLRQVSISDRIRGRTPLTLVDIHRLARHFDVAPTEFFPSTSVYESACTTLAQVRPHLRLVA